MSWAYDIVLVVFLATLVRDYAGAQSNSTSTNTTTPSETRKPTFFATQCGFDNEIFLLNSTYKKNLDYVLFSLIEQSKLDSYGESGASQNTPDAVYGKYYCRGDILMNSTLCSACVEAAAQRVRESCPGVRNGAVWFQECALRFSNATMVGVLAEYPRAWWSSAANVSGLSTVINDTVARLVHVAAFDSNLTGYAANESANVPASGKAYCLVQCSRDVAGPACDTCLRAAAFFASNLTSNYSSRWAFVYLASCQVSYSTIRRFYALPGDPPVASFTQDLSEPLPIPVQSVDSAPVTATPPATPLSGDGVKLVAIIVVGVCLGLSLIGILSCIWFCVLRKEVKHMNSSSRRHLRDGSDTESVERTGNI